MADSEQQGRWNNAWKDFEAVERIWLGKTVTEVRLEGPDHIRLMFDGTQQLMVKRATGEAWGPTAAPPQAGLTDEVRSFLRALESSKYSSWVRETARGILAGEPRAPQADLRLDDNERWRIIYSDDRNATAMVYARGRELTDLLRQVDPSRYLRGHAGRSAAPPELREYIDQAIAVLRELQNSAIVPHDFHAGAIAALELVRRQFDKEG